LTCQVSIEKLFMLFVLLKSFQISLYTLQTFYACTYSNFSLFYQVCLLCKPRICGSFPSFSPADFSKIWPYFHSLASLITFNTSKMLILWSFHLLGGDQATNYGLRESSCFSFVRPIKSVAILFCFNPFIRDYREAY
jgi:hypothetical protein